MLSLARNGYTYAEVQSALHSAHRRLSFRYELYDSTGTYKADLTGVVDGVINYNALADNVKRTARFTLKEQDGVDYLTDRIKPIARLMMPDGGYAEFPLGVFLLTTTPRTVNASVVYRTIEAYDLLQVLLDDKATTRYVVLSGANFIDTVRSILTGAGITAVNLTTASNTLPVTRDWEPGTPKLRIINDLLAAINYDSLWFDENGIAVARPYLTPASRASEYTYQDNGESVIFPEAEQSIDLWNVPNKMVLVVSEADRDVLRSEYTNTNASSPTSTVSRGRTIVAYETVEADNQASLDAMVARRVFEASQVYETVQFGTAIMPHHSHADVLTLVYSKLGTTQKYAEVAWSFQLKAGSRMTHIIRRVLAV